MSNHRVAMAGELPSIPHPPWWSPEASRRPEPLTRDRILDAALAVVDEEGLDALSMRRVAVALDTGPSSLYAHVRNKAELLDMLFDRVIAEMPLPEPDPANWQRQLKQWLFDMRRVLLSHRDIARVTLGRVPVGPNGLRAIEWVLGLLRSAGLPDQVAAYAGDLLSLYVGAYAYEESLRDDPGSGSFSDEDYDAVTDYFASLPADQFPNIAAIAGVLTSGDTESRFEFGIDMFIAGLAAQVQGPPAKS